MNRRELEAQLLAKISEVIPIIVKNNDPKNLLKSVFSSSRGKGLIIAMDYSEKEKLDAPAKYLLGLEKINKKYSEEYIENMLLDCFAELLFNEKGLNDYIKAIIDKLLTSEDKEYVIISELENIELIDDRKYEFIDSTIKMLKKEDIPFDASSIRLPGTDIINKPAIITKVRAGEKEKAKEIALHRFLVSLNLIRLYVPFYRPALKGCLHSSIQSLIVHEKTDKSISTDMKRVGNTLLKRAKISSELYNKMLESGIGELKKENSISRVVKECLYWYGLGLDESYPAAKLINFVTVLESALKKKGELTELKRAVAERGAILLNDKYEDRKAAFEHLSQIYALRSKVVHTGAFVYDKDLVSKAGGYARAVLIALIEKSKSFNGNFDEFINHIDDIKLGKVENVQDNY
jgi:hypothetical protein